jgi:hypothetical protein
MERMYKSWPPNQYGVFYPDVTMSASCVLEPQKTDV